MRIVTAEPAHSIFSAEEVVALRHALLRNDCRAAGLLGRLPLCHRAAPSLQATWIGYPNSTGLQAVDYRFTDAVCDPLDTSQVRCPHLAQMPKPKP